ncbi:unannotated protein [freshwater metagenome]|uniref:Unannotated protein n=1 Tax=freshwater metagenome TaxID=449393 RepID=A0A6J6Q5J6_9ZZZZ
MGGVEHLWVSARSDAQLEELLEILANCELSEVNEWPGEKKIQKSGAKRGKVVDKGGSWGAKWRT